MKGEYKFDSCQGSSVDLKVPGTGTFSNLRNYKICL